jgi:hypothetical protein
MDVPEELKRHKELAERVRQVDERTWQAENPEEALAWLRWYYYWPMSVAAEVSSGEKRVMRIPRRCFFRGHAVSSWPLMPSIFRGDPSELPLRQRASELAATIVEVEFETLWSQDGAQAWPPIWEGCGMAAAQHYGIPTKLLDWTSNPSVAVSFATGSKSSTTSKEGAVLVLDVDDARELGAHLNLPPPYVRRLYRQRGLFTNLSAEQASEIEQRCRRIVFPPQPFLPAQVTRDGKNIEAAELLPADAWFENLKAWCIQRARESTDPIDRVPENMRFTANHGSYPERVEDFIAIFVAEEMAADARGFIDELARRNKRAGFCYDPKVLRLVERDNPKFINWLERAFGRLPRCGS